MLMTFVQEEGRGMPPGEVDLMAYIAWILYEVTVAEKSFRQYLLAIRHFSEGEKISSLSPTPK